MKEIETLNEKYHTEKVNENLSMIKFNDKSFGELIKLEDGYYYFNPLNNGGVIAPYALRAIANILDELNKDWDEEVKESLGKLT